MRVIAAGAAAVLIVLGGATVAGAAKSNTAIKDFQAKQVDRDAVEYSGKLKGKRACRHGRLIRIYHKKVLIAEGFTDDDGRFELRGPVPPDGDKVIAELEPTGPDDEVECSGDRTSIKFRE